jgi:hypothetical protein
VLSNYNIKYICTIYTHLDTCLMSISRFSLRDEVKLRLLKLHFYGADVVELSRALDIRLSDWCCSVSMVWVPIPKEEKKLTAKKSNSNTVWFNFQTSEKVANVWIYGMLDRKQVLTILCKQTKIIYKRLKCSTTSKKMLKYNKNNY